MKHPVFRYGLIILLFIFMLWLGLMREEKLLVLKNFMPTFINRYPKIALTNYENVMHGLSGFNLAPRLQSSILFSLSYMMLTSLILYLLSLSRFIAKLSIVLYVSYMVVCFILIRLGTYGVDYRLSIGLSHYLEDLFVSPFFVMAIAVLLKAFGFIPGNAKQNSIT